jgi:cation:H+ antiporter
MGILIPIILIVVTSIVIWKSSDGFDVASSYLGRNLSNGVKGATINAISSSIPELLTTVFFLIFIKDAEGFSGGMGTVAGSAVFNAMIIPALSVLAVYYYGISKTIKISKNVIYRDSFALLISQIALILIIYYGFLTWSGGLILILLYGIYVFYMFYKMPSTSSSYYEKLENKGIIQNRIVLFLKLDFYSSIIGNKRLNKNNAILLLVISLIFIGLSCLLLVKACEMLGQAEYAFLGLENLKGLDLPISIVAVIIAAAATSVPDTIISIKDARKGNYNDAISNALGSNIFDICFALGLPILIYTIFYGPIEMDPATISFSLNVLIVLFILTIITFLIFISGETIGVAKATLLLLMYAAFIGYIFIFNL